MMPVLYPKVEKIVCEHLNIPYVPTANPVANQTLPQSLSYGTALDSLHVGTLLDSLHEKDEKRHGSHKKKKKSKKKHKRKHKR
jgi:hypothetical protein